MMDAVFGAFVWAGRAMHGCSRSVGTVERRPRRYLDVLETPFASVRKALPDDGHRVPSICLGWLFDARVFSFTDYC